MASVRYKSKNEVFYGVEQMQWDMNKAYTTQIGNLLSFYNNMVETKTKQGYLNNYLKTINHPTKALPDIVINQLGALARMIDLGFPISQQHKDYIISQMAKYNVVKKKAEIKKTVDVPISVTITYTAFDELFDSMVDGAKASSFTKPVGMPAQYSKEFKEYVNGIKDELTSLDPEIQEGYEHINKTMTKRLVKLCDDTITQYTTIRKAQEPRKKKPISKEKLVKGIKYTSQSEEYRVKSLKPVNMLDSKEVYIFNVKTRKLTRFTSKSGMSVKGASLIGYDKAETKTIRKPLDVLPVFTGKAWKRQTVFFDKINAVAKDHTGRINGDTVILNIRT